MKFLNVSLFALTSLFAASSAAPTAQGTSLIHVRSADVKNPVTNIEALNVRTDDTICEKVQATIDEVKKHTLKINSTISSISGSISEEDKTRITTTIKGELTVVIQLINTLVGEVVGLIGDTVGNVEQDKLVSLLLGLILEIACTIKNVLLVLKISIFDLLGSLALSLLSVTLHLLTVLNVLVDGTLKHVFDLLSGVFGLISDVLAGLFPIVSGIAGSLLGKIGGILSCLF
ncbi:hypothetical protein EJ04DRAFT_565251 [Polyplosphaeria fusca]|uniref:Uncharacterized protein n=1 Tax=Polyplosphaeria fusca TaxID=682080 RepID=A0A9P4QVQ4_9PLEO|nr:hypothetical protein EJ04DRAFT_565251 [Polyplosphaeria fusca]